jgi:hypothetical protein
VLGGPLYSVWLMKYRHFEYRISCSTHNMLVHTAAHEGSSLSRSCDGNMNLNFNLVTHVHFHSHFDLNLDVDVRVLVAMG